ncbi:MAG TPA: globin domain-containing protein [Waterburya sp.]|jgi:hemoglobin-like flavoprotein
MSTNNFLSPQQKEQLQKALRESNDSSLREGCLILLLINHGKTAREITDLLGCSYRTVAYWQFQGVPQNLESLPIQREFHQESRKAFSVTKEEEGLPLFDVKILQETFVRVKLRSTEFSSNFYKNLFTDYPELRPLFTYTSMETQERKLMISLVSVINNLRNLSYLRSILKELGEKHVEYGVVQAYYPMVGATLLKTLESFLGLDWTPQVKQAWEDGYEAIANLMIQQ